MKRTGSTASAQVLNNTQPEEFDLGASGFERDPTFAKTRQTWGTQEGEGILPCELYIARNPKGWPHGLA
jgi:hypothetical protein